MSRPLPRPVPPPAKSGDLPASPLVQWFRPDEDVELELVGDCGASTRELLEQLRRLDAFLRAGVDPPTRVLLSGPSGTGKTLTARWIARQLEAPIAIVDVGNISSKWAGESQKQLAEAFAVAKRVAGALLFFDEIDAICMSRDAGGDSGADAERARVTTTFFQQIDWLPPGQLVFAATNFADKLDPALRRRLTTHITFALPDRAERRRMLDLWLARAPVTLRELDELADATEGLAGAELRSAAMAAARAAIMALPAQETAQLTLADAGGDNVRRLRPKPPEDERASNSAELVAALLKTLDDFQENGSKKTTTPGARR